MRYKSELSDMSRMWVSDQPCQPWGETLGVPCPAWGDVGLGDSLSQEAEHCLGCPVAVVTFLGWVSVAFCVPFHQNRMPPSCFMAKPSKNSALTIK